MIEKYKNKYRIQSHRKPEWDYSSDGIYFITLVTQGRICNLGKIIATGGDADHPTACMELSDFGKIVNDEWLKSFNIRNELILHAYIIMPNHLHAIIAVNQPRCIDSSGTDKTGLLGHGTGFTDSVNLGDSVNLVNPFDLRESCDLRDPDDIREPCDLRDSSDLPEPRGWWDSSDLPEPCGWWVETHGRASLQRDDTSPQRNDGTSPQRNDGTSPQRNDDTSPQQRDDTSPQRNDGTSPQRNGGASLPQHGPTFTPADAAQPNTSPCRDKNDFVRKPRSISSFIAGFKSAIHSKIDDYIDLHQLDIPKYNRRNHFFQPNYHDHVIQNDGEYQRIKKYIINNPSKWVMDGFQHEYRI